MWQHKCQINSVNSCQQKEKIERQKADIAGLLANDDGINRQLQLNSSTGQCREGKETYSGVNLQQ